MGGTNAGDSPSGTSVEDSSPVPVLPVLEQVAVNVGNSGGEEQVPSSSTSGATKKCDVSKGHSAETLCYLLKWERSY